MHNDAMSAADDLSAQRGKTGEPREAAGAPWPEPLGDAAYHGLAGEIARAIEPETEADPAAVLIQLLAAFGNIVERRYFYVADGTRHHGNIFVALVGRTAKGRKGTSWARVRDVLWNTTIVGDWLDGRVMSGLSSGEGLIHQVRDPVTKINDGEEVVVDEGVTDKRLLVHEAEFTRVLRVMERSDNTVSAIIRAAWDGGNLHVLTRKSPLHATGPHVSIVAHTTVEDLRRYLQDTDAANGFGNRFLYACVRRSKLLPRGGDRAALRRKMCPLEERLRRTIDRLCFGEHELEEAAEREVTWADDAARARWDAFYAEEAVERPGMLGAITARGEAQVVRLTLLYALLDGAEAMRLEHLEAAIAIWRYCLASARHAFGDALGDATADTILEALRGAWPEGMSRTALHGLFGRNLRGAELGRALGRLLTLRLAACESVLTEGRPTELWRAPPTP